MEVALPTAMLHRGDPGPVLQPTGRPALGDPEVAGGAPTRECAPRSLRLPMWCAMTQGEDPTLLALPVGVLTHEWPHDLPRVGGLGGPLDDGAVVHTEGTDHIPSLWALSSGTTGIRGCHP